MPLPRTKKYSEQENKKFDESTLLEKLPYEILLQTIELIAAESKTKVVDTILNIRAASSNLFFFATGRHFNRISAKALTEMVELVITSNVKKVDELITQCPRLLFAPIPSVTIKRNNIPQTYKNYTLLQLARGEGDEALFALLKSHIIRACGNEEAGLAEIAKQLDEKFSKEAFQKENRKELMADLLYPLINAIKAEKFANGRDAANKLILSEDTHNAIKKFRDGFMALMQNEITHGMRFDIEILHKLFEIYVSRESELSDSQCKLLEAAAISFVLRYSPSNDAQKYSQGLYYLQRQENPEPFKATVLLRNNEGNFFEVLGRPSLYFAGLDGICVDVIFGGRFWSARTVFVSPWGGGAADFTDIGKLMSIKNASLDQPLPTKTTRCVIL